MAVDGGVTVVRPGVTIVQPRPGGQMTPAVAASRHMDSDDQERLDALAERETAYALFQRAGALLKRRHHAQAAVLLERADRLEPRKGSIVEALGRAYYNSGQHERAVASFRELIDIDPSAPYGHFGLGQSLKMLGQRDEARAHLRLAVALAPNSSLYRNALSRLGSVQ